MFTGCEKDISDQRRAMPAAGLLLVAFAILLARGTIAQSYDARWIGGYPGGPPPAFGGNKTLFLSGSNTFSQAEPHTMHLGGGMAVITDEQDSILAYTNGWRLNNAAHLPMLNGDGLNPTTFVSMNTGMAAPWSNLFLPWPERPDSIILVHVSPDTISSTNALHSKRIYYSVVVRDLDAPGLAGVASSNNTLHHAPHIQGGLCAVKHANGRDWWVLSHEYGSDRFVRFLLSPAGFSSPNYQAIGSILNGSVPGPSFSMQGDRLAYGHFQTGLDIFDFDRCTGLLANRRNVGFADQAFFRNAQFSADGQKLYVPGGIYLYQLSLDQNGDVAAMDTVAFYDGFYDDNPVFATYFVNPMLARDGRIYISTGNSTRYMHVVNDPDLRACSRSSIEGTDHNARLIILIGPHSMEGVD